MKHVPMFLILILLACALQCSGTDWDEHAVPVPTPTTKEQRE